VNVCRVCGEDFSSLEIFDGHRVGRHEVDFSAIRRDGRRCLSVDEMSAKGWQLDSRGRWVDPARAVPARTAFTAAA
jgi:hypothetical protein